jgi:hypothetical protein
MQFGNIIKARFKKIDRNAIFFTVLVCLLIILTTSVYLPRRRKVAVLKTGLDKKEQSINDIVSVLETKGMEGMLKIKKDYLKAKVFFPESPDEILRYVSERARFLELRVTSLTSADAKLLLEDSKKIEVNGGNLYALPVNMTIISSYENLSTYLKNLHDESPYLIRIEKITIKKESEATDNLTINLHLICYYKQP